MARALKTSRKTIEKYFLENSLIAKKNNKQNLDKGKIVTTYVQFDELETFEHTKRKPLGVQVSIRAKTGEIISAKVGTIQVKALAVSKSYINYWNSKLTRSIAIKEALKETKKALNKDYSLISFDEARQPLKIASDIYGDNSIQVHKSKAKNKRIDLCFLKMRQDISRLRRRTLATTKRRENLQRHLDLYIDYHNKYRVA